jgi:hypothetical protein
MKTRYLAINHVVSVFKRSYNLYDGMCYLGTCWPAVHFISKGKGKGKAIPATGHEGP